MTEQELCEYVGPVTYKPFADVIPERGVYGGLTKAGWAYVWFEGKDEPEEVEPWCLTIVPPGSGEAAISELEKS